MSRRLVVAILCIAAVAYACAPRINATERGAHATTARPSKGDTALVAALDLRPAGREVAMIFRVANPTAKAVELRFPDGRTHDFAVLDADGREVWRWSTGRFYTQSIQTRTVSRDEEVRYEGAWRAAAPGTYTVVATLASRKHPLVQRAQVTVR